MMERKSIVIEGISTDMLSLLASVTVKQGLEENSSRISDSQVLARVERLPVTPRAARVPATT